MWFFNLPDAPWHDLPHGVEGLVGEAGVVDLAPGPATFTLVARPGDGPEPAADRNLDCLLLTTDLDDGFRGRGARAYPLLDEIGTAQRRRAWLRIANPGDSGESFHVEARYTVNRVPWTLPTFVIDRAGIAAQGARPRRLEPGERTPWVDISCRDTTHPGHLQLLQQNNSQNRRVTLELDIASAPSDDALLRRLSYREEASARLVLNLPPYPARAPREILTGEEVLERIVAALRDHPAPVGMPPRRTPVYAGFGDEVEKNLTNPTRLYQLYRRLFFLLGPNAFNQLGVGALAAELQAMREEGRQPGRTLLLGDFRWYPSDENIAKAAREVDAAQARPYLRGFTYGDEVSLQGWAPKDDRDEGLRGALQARGIPPEDVLPADVAAAGEPEERWDAVRFVADPRDAPAQPRLYVESRRYLEGAALDRLAAQSTKLRETFGQDIVYGATYSPHPYFWPDQALWVQAFRRGATNRAIHSDYWWQAGELGPQMTGYLLDVFRCGLRDRLAPGGGVGAIEPYVMPHSPGNTDADFRRGVYTALAHGAKGLDFFQVGPEQSGTENYIRSDDFARYRTLRDVTYEIGAVDDLIADGRLRPASVAIVLSESTDDWERAAAGVADGISEQQRFPSIAYNLERKCVWTALRHAQVPVDFVTEGDLADGNIGRYRVLYLVGDHLGGAAARALAGWVTAGGTLVSTAGGGLRDEYGAPSEPLAPVFGITGQQLDKQTTFIRPRIELPRLVPLDVMSGELDGQPIQVPALAFRQQLESARDAQVLARWTDGSPAAVRRRHGSGTAYLWGALVGTAYVKSGFPDPLPPPDRGPFTHTPLTGFEPDLSRPLTAPVQGVPKTWAECSDPLVETGVLETDRALLVPLAALQDGPRSVDLTVHAADRARAVRSVRRGALPFRQESDRVRCTLDLDLADFVVVER